MEYQGEIGHAFPIHYLHSLPTVIDTAVVCPLCSKADSYAMECLASPLGAPGEFPVAWLAWRPVERKKKKLNEAETEAKTTLSLRCLDFMRRCLLLTRWHDKNGWGVCCYRPPSNICILINHNHHPSLSLTLKQTLLNAMQIFKYQHPCILKGLLKLALEERTYVPDH